MTRSGPGSPRAEEEPRNLPGTRPPQPHCSPWKGCQKRACRSWQPFCPPATATMRRARRKRGGTDPPIRAHRHERADRQFAYAMMAQRHNVPSRARLTAAPIGPARYRTSLTRAVWSHRPITVSSYRKRSVSCSTPTRYASPVRPPRRPSRTDPPFLGAAGRWLTVARGPSSLTPA